MNFVQPIKEINTIKAIAKYLKEKNERDYIMFLMGIYSGLRISDILSLKVKDVQDGNISIKEKKTGKSKKFKQNPVLKQEVKKYIEGKQPDDYLIQSRNGFNRPISRSRAYMILQDVANKFKIGSFGTHSLRKTFGYHCYEQKKDLAILQEIFNHSRIEYTLRYIGIVQETIDSAIEDIRIL
ncbi:MAG: tyrosine-type recombinase/integrase [Bacillota bacterium]